MCSVYLLLCTAKLIEPKEICKMTMATMASLDSQTISERVEEFFREGCVLFPNVLTADEVAALRAKTDEYAAKSDPASKYSTYAANAFVLRYCQELDPVFHAMMTHPSILKVVEAVLGPNAKFIITGDLTQIDLPRKDLSGLPKAIRILEDVQGIKIAYLSFEDVVRHRLVKDIIKAYEKLENKTTNKE